MKRLAVLLLFLAASASAITSVDPAAVSAAAEYSARYHGVSFLAIQDRRTLLEQNAKTPHKIYSGTKAFWNLAALAAVEDSLLNLDERVGDTITSWRSDPRKAQVTIRQLLDFDSGLEPQFFLHETQSGDRDAAAMRAFSLGWWNNRAAPNGREFDFEQMLIPKWQNQDWRDACLCRDAPSDLVACIGSQGQRLYVIPSLQLIVVRQGNGGSFSDAHFLRLLLGRERR